MRRPSTIGGFPVGWVVSGIAVLCGVVAGFAWMNANAEVTGGEADAACLLLIDRTSSASHADTVESYKDAASKIVAGCDQLNADLAVGHFDLSSAKLHYVDGIDGSSMFPLYRPEGNVRNRQDREEAEIVAAALEAVERVLEEPDLGPPVRGSDLLTPLHASAHQLHAMAAQSGVDDLFLVMLTDGLQMSEAVNVQTLGDEHAFVDALVESTRTLGLIPALDNVQFSMIGVRGGLEESGGALPDYFEAKVVEYWATVIEEGGGRVCQMTVDAVVFPGRC